MSNDTTRRRSRKKNRLRGLKAIDWVRDDLAGKLPEGEYSVLLLLSTRCDGDFKCFPGIRSIAATLRRNERTIIRRLNSLEERGLIHKKRRPNTSTLYTLNVPSGPDAAVTSGSDIFTSRPDTHVTSGPDTTVTSGSDTLIQQKKTDIEEDSYEEDTNEVAGVPPAPTVITLREETSLREEPEQESISEMYERVFKEKYGESAFLTRKAVGQLEMIAKKLEEQGLTSFELVESGLREYDSFRLAAERMTSMFNIPSRPDPGIFLQGLSALVRWHKDHLKGIERDEAREIARREEEERQQRERFIEDYFMLNDEYREVSETLSATYHCNYETFATPERRQLAFDEWQSCDDQWQWCKDEWNRPEDINRVDLKDWHIERCKKIIAELEPRLRPEAELAYEQLPERLLPVDDFCGPRLRLPLKR